MILLLNQLEYIFWTLLVGLCELLHFLPFQIIIAFKGNLENSKAGNTDSEMHSRIGGVAKQMESFKKMLV